MYFAYQPTLKLSLAVCLSVCLSLSLSQHIHTQTRARARTHTHTHTHTHTLLLDLGGGSDQPKNDPKENHKPPFYYYLLIINCIFIKIDIQSTLVISNSKGLSEILRDIRSSTYQVCRIEEKIIWLTTFNKLIGNWTFEVRDILKILWKRGEIAPYGAISPLFYNIFHLLLGFHV